MAVGALESLGLLFNFAGDLTQAIPNMDIVVSLFGTISAVIDNVPLVAASMGMFSQGPDDPIWHAIAFAAGTGGSMLVFGSAAGVVAMGMEKINFFWYFKKISILAFVGFSKQIMKSFKQQSDGNKNQYDVNDIAYCEVIIMNVYSFI